MSGCFSIFERSVAMCMSTVRVVGKFIEHRAQSHGGFERPAIRFEQQGQPVLRGGGDRFGRIEFQQLATGGHRVRARDGRRRVDDGPEFGLSVIEAWRIKRSRRGKPGGGRREHQLAAGIESKGVILEFVESRPVRQARPENAGDVIRVRLSPLPRLVLRERLVLPQRNKARRRERDDREQNENALPEETRRMLARSFHRVAAVAIC